MKTISALTWGLLLIGVSSAAVAEWDKRGNISAQVQLFTDDAIHSADQSTNLSISSEVEFYRDIGENGSITITPFLRLDQHDDQRSHFDFRELLYTHVADQYEWRIGLGKVFWGVAESLNVVDVINQRDAIEGGDRSDKLGQPMINLFASREWGDIEFFILPGFREQTLAGEDGRPRPPTVINSDAAQFESSDGSSHVDFALRFVKILGDWDIGLHAFNGTARNPGFIFNTNTGELDPFYYQKTQFGIDAQATLESWLLKFELVTISADAVEDHIESVSGFEYSFYGIADTDTDLGVVAEWMYDDRDNSSNFFQNDFLLGLRFALNDEQSTDALIGVISDLDGDGEILSIEANRRIGSNFKASLDLRYWLNQPDDSFFDTEDYIQLELGYFF